MTDRDEVERLIDELRYFDGLSSYQAGLDELHAAFVALRQRAEAAEAERDECAGYSVGLQCSMGEALIEIEDLKRELAEARDAAWNAAIEAAAIAAEATPDELVGTMELTPSQYVVADAIRALPRQDRRGGGVMGETEKLIAEIATRFLLAHVEKSGLTNDPAYPARALTYAKAIVNGAQKKEPRL